MKEGGHTVCFSKNRTGYLDYDIEGNVSSILIDVPHDSIVHQRYKRINYYYDLISGKVTETIYEPDSIDQFIHVYQYNSDNQITDVMTSRDSLYWENDASYQYYDHGPLAREILGQRQVQGIDYAYTINGWLKVVNSSLGSYKVRTWPPSDMGEDGYVHGANVTIGRVGAEGAVEIIVIEIFTKSKFGEGHFRGCLWMRIKKNRDRKTKYFRCDIS